MANQILRPSSDGHYTNWTPSSGTTRWEMIDEPDADGDTSYVTASSAGAFTVGCTDAVAGAWPRATRVCSVRVVATVRTTVTESVYQVRLRLFGTDYDSTVRATNSTSYVEQDEVYVLTPNAYAWDLTTLNNMEVGLVFSSGDPMRCTKLEVFLHYEPFPHYTLAPEGNGILQNWTPNPSGSPAYMVVSGVYDGDLSYLEDQTVNNRSTFVTENLPASLSPANIDRVSVKGLVKNVGTVAEHADIVVYSGGNYFNGGTNTTSIEIPADNEWRLLSEDYLNDPGTVWPSGDPAASAWSAAQVNGIEVGVENAGGGDFRCTSLAAEVWLAPTAATAIDLFPSADGYHADWTNIVPSAPAWGTVDEDPPDDIISYVSLDADTPGTPVYCSFDVTGVGSVPAGERIYNVELRCRVRLDNLPHSSATVVPVMRDTSGTAETYIGKPQLIEGIGATWIDVKWDFHQNPHTGLPWVDLAEVNTAMEYGLGVLDGQLLLSRVRAQVQTTTDYRGVSAAMDLRFTDEGEYWINRAKADGTTYGYWNFAVGIGGYDVTAPTIVTAVDPTHTSLVNEIYRAEVDRIEFDSTAAAPTVDFWCRVPQDEAIGGIGEVALFAQILWSPIPGEAGTWFCYAIGHFPCQTRTQQWSNVHFYKLRIQHHDCGAQLLVDGDMEYKGTQLLVDGDMEAGPGPELIVDGDMEAGYGPETLVDGNMEAIGTAAWTASGGGIPSKQTTSPHSGTRLLRVAGIVGGRVAQNNSVVLGDTYRIRGWARSDGVTIPGVHYGASGVAIWTGTISTSWQYFDVVAAADTVNGFLYQWQSGAGSYVEFDDISVVATCPDWLTTGSPLLTKVAGSPGGSGSQVMHIAYNGTNYPGARQITLVAGRSYRATGWARGDGTYAPRIYVGVGFYPWTGTSSTVWQQFDVSFVSNATSFFIVSTVTAAGWVEYDDVSVVETCPDWTEWRSALLTKETTTPYEGLQCLRVTYGGMASPAATQTLTTVGHTYRVIGAARGDGTYAPQIQVSALGTIWTGTSSNTWQVVDVSFVAGGTSVYLYSLATAAGYAEFDVVIITEDCPAWTLQNTPLLSKESGSYEGSYCMRVAYDGTNYPMGYQTVLTTGVLYWAHGWAHGDGTIAPALENAGVLLWTGAASFTWQEFSFLFVASGTTFKLRAQATGAGCAKFDDIEVREVLSHDFLTHGVELVADNDQEAAGTAAWTSGNSAALTKTTSFPYQGTQSLRITYNAVNNPYAEQTILSIGTIYHAVGRMRSDGTGVPAVYDGAVLLWTGTTEVSWQYFDVAFEATSTDLRYWCGIAAAGHCDVDLVSCKAITPP